MTAMTERLLARVLASDDLSAENPSTERILDAALEQFLLVGLRRTTIDDVARRAGVGRVTIYRRLGQKHELVEAVMLREVRRVIATVAASIAPLRGIEERVIEAFVVGLGALREHPLLRRLLETEPEDLLPYLTLDAGASLAIGRRFVADQIRGADDAGGREGAAGIDPELVAEILTRLAQSLVLTPDGGIPLDHEQQRRSFARACLAPIVSRAGSSSAKPRPAC